uniref:Reverse transcriptase domain-containing protein n=1 Tax=Xenopus tropicalis TaxID=8364 RepID=A0A803JBM0_XENTR
IECSWILDFLTNRPQVVWIGNITSSTLTLSTGAPQGCVLRPLLYTLFTHNCTATHCSNTIIKFADNATIIGCISDGDESAYRAEVRALTSWCHDNNLLLNVNKTEELIVDYRRLQGGGHTPIHIEGAEVERVSCFRFLGINISEDLSWSHHVGVIIKAARQQLFFLRRLRRFGMDSRILSMVHRQKFVSGCITTWYGSCNVLDRKALQRVVRSAQRITRTELPAMQDLYRQHCKRKMQRIFSDPSHRLFTLLPSGRWYRSIQTRTSRYRDSFYPQAIRLLNY